ncbi:winged helix-turn-helix domain-containing protein [Thalassotalea crassostreae]|uniref:winged helix-turn-helix domain-containing protein n=1 Tax=Thalassotalea crassostreae TaxID=1763536 RepID=UPI000837FC86|nr:winged helix-turn-helix domain-containing protein [Thalassotalea crassostreae]
MSNNDLTYRLEDWLIYPEQSTITNNGELIHLEPKVMEVLVYLIKNSNRVISRQELTDNVWQSRHTSDEVITRAISILRKKLHDTGKVHHFIKTIPKHGYILECDDVGLDPRQEESLQQNLFDVEKSSIVIHKKLVLLGILTIILVIGLTSVVLVKQNKAHPVDNKIYISLNKFEALDGSQNTEMVANSITEQLITTLSNSEHIRVTVGQTDTPEVISENVFKIAGVVQQIDLEFQINLHFINAETGIVIWSQSFAGDKSQWHELVTNISNTIDYFLEVAIQDSLDLHSLTLQNLQAAIVVHQARQLRIAGGNENLNEAINMLENSLYAFPGETILISELALSHFIKNVNSASEGNFDRVEQLLKLADNHDNNYPSYWLTEALFKYKTAKITLQQALTIINEQISNIDKNAEAQALTGNLYRISGDLYTARSLLQTAVSKNPNYAYATYTLARIQNELGEHQQSISLLESFLNQHPANQNILRLLLKNYIGISKFNRAVNIVNKIEQSKLNQSHELVGDSYYYLGLNESAFAAYDKIAVNGNPMLQYQRLCVVNIMKKDLVQASQFCQLAKENKSSLLARFYMARLLMLKGDYQLAKAAYELNFEVLKDRFRAGEPNELLYEKTDYVFLLSKTGELDKAQTIANELLAKLESTPRMGYNGYGIADVILLLAIKQPDRAFKQYQKALEDGWLHWNDWRYGGPHPALVELTNSIDFNQWQSYIDESLSNQRKMLTSLSE